MEKSNTIEIGTGALLELIVASATANSEEDQELLMQVMQPSNNRNEMGDVYNAVLGYNPIKYFDENDLRRLYVGFINKAPADIKEILTENEDEFIKVALESIDEEKGDYLSTLLADIIADKTGWVDPSMGDDGDDDNSSFESIDEEDDDINEDDMDDDDDDDEGSDGDDE